MTDNEPPARTFRALYTLATAGGVALAVAILVWLLWTLFTHSPVGTAQSQAFEKSLPTRTALAQLVPPPPGMKVVLKPPDQCWACHTAAAKPCPNLAGVGTRANDRIAGADYTGKATTPAEYILESIQTPHMYVVEGYPDNVMPPCGGLPNCSDEAVMPYVEFLLTYQGG